MLPAPPRPVEIIYSNVGGIVEQSRKKKTEATNLVRVRGCDLPSAVGRKVVGAVDWSRLFG
jgi:hypothetical protein